MPAVVYTRPTAAPTPGTPARTAVDPLRGSFAEFARPSGPDLMARTAAIVPWIQARREAEVWPYARAITSAPGATTRAEAEAAQAAFEDTDWGPRLASAPTWGGVRLSDARDVGWSSLVTCTLEHVVVGADDDPLLHRRGRFARG